ncbi:MAG: 2-C-methyl-D-erythritol 2,4-cyclodiphosphate synthase, partial [Flavobacteriales bacterium]|nr:2-C-methyl-D-erythritol 2,4-cyclodiphosphate synthase [Flavobacteriales bacterium]
SAEDVSIKATTNERIGFVGREEGVAAYSVVLIQRSPAPSSSPS